MISHHNFLELFHHKELNELYLSVALRWFALALIGIYVPIHLVEIGESIPSVLIFLAIVNATHALTAPLMASVGARYGVKHLMVLSQPFLLIFYVLLVSLESYNWPLLLLGMVWGISKSLYFTGYHFDLALSGKEGQRGTEIGVIHIAVSLAKMLAPILGALIITYVGFTYLGVVVIILLVLSVIPLLMSRDRVEPFAIEWKNIFAGRRIRDGIAFFAHGVDSGVGIFIWPLFIFYAVFHTYTGVGAIVSLSMAVSLVLTYVIGKFSDTHRNRTMNIGAVFNAINWVARIFVNTPLHAFMTDAVSGTTQKMIVIPIDAETYTRAQKDAHVGGYIIYREMCIQLGRVALFLGLAYAADSITTGFIAAAVASLAYLLFW